MIREQEVVSQKVTPAVNLSARELAIKHWNTTPLYLTEEERYSTYPWLRQAAEFEDHEGERVLEIGCGTGSDLLQFAKHGAKAVGIDVTPEHIRLANRRVGNAARLLRASATLLPFSDNSFDYVYSHGVVHHIDHPRSVVTEIFRVLRPQGRFNIQVYALWSWAHLAYRLRYGRRWKDFIENSREPVHIDLYSTKGMRRLLAPAEVTFRKYELRHAPKLSGLLGWFLVATGSVKK
jgi:SAM-dependent methyltransferase